MSVVDLPRETALKILYEIDTKAAYSNISVNKHLSRGDLRTLDKTFITELVYGITKWRLTLDFIIEKYSKTKLNKISPWIINILRMGIYQLKFMSSVPESAAVNESVKLSKKYGHAAVAGYVNGVLRNVAREGKEIHFPDENKDYIYYLSIKYSHPMWMVKSWLKRYGKEFTESLLDSNNKIPTLTVRANTLKSDSRQLLQLFEQNGINGELCRYYKEGIIIITRTSITEMPGYPEGLFQVQDESSMLVGQAVDPRPGEIVVDVCSAPGGKATHLGELMKNQGSVIARDIHPHKIKLIEDSVNRLGLTNVKTEIFDALEIDENLIGKADRVLVDAPCTGLGIIRRKPDIKWARTDSEKKEIISLQKKILEAASNYVRPGGVLVYSTCTIGPEENQMQMDDFLSRHPEFKPANLAEVMPAELQKETAAQGYIQLYPNSDETDGFFISKLIKMDR